MHPTSYYEMDGWGFGDFSYGISDDEDYEDMDDLLEEDSPWTIHREIEMDGDKYVVTILTEELYHAMLQDKAVVQALAEVGDALDRQKTPLLKKWGGKFYLVSNEDPDIVLCEWDMNMDSPLVIAKATDKGYLYRPVLIPLCPDGTVDSTMASANPNGSVVIGGQLKMVTSGFLGRNKLLEFYDSGEDANCDDCTWVWFNGMMVGVNCRFFPPPKQLVEQHLTSELVLQMAKSV